ncbi:hypothetical protein [Meiothermus granaticius]|uniref:Uncharacterized protein n=1 Tax=Meiothermus granaticius NBRC 107808 TaxID=1227551 RepID=A0A399F9B7_9DEIN|nr:hypothetical protein [Meiothermus granaticius]RIH92693.1 hypothetical protein Mgrana_01355 [Meiothermus granaticius NBRC 107808]GEM87746.1 hypothetical protein MGR01S_23710 [Meiothermus granaticius NBRC 107808]
MAHLNQTFVALLKEAQFTKELLGSGATQIRQANYASKGLYFQSFANLSTGLERIGKLCLILDHYIETQGSFPDFKYLKNEIGHNLNLLQEKAEKMALHRGWPNPFPSSAIHKAIVELLSEFAEGDRYSNFDLLVGANRQADPIASWYERVDLPLFESRVTAKKKHAIVGNAKLISSLIGPISSVLHISETGEEITDVENASRNTGVFEAVAPHRQLHVLQIIRAWVKLLGKLQHVAQALGRDDIPFFDELFAAFENDDAYMKTRKTWVNI